MPTLSSRFPLEHMALHVDAWRRSGLTRKQYALQHDISFNRLRNWIQRLAAPATEPDFIPAHIASATPHETAVMLHLPCGIRLSCPLAMLAEVIQVITHAQT
jgi:hypothetical protein